MKAKDLIEELKCVDDDMEVMIYAGDGNFRLIRAVVIPDDDEEHNIAWLEG